MKDLVAKLKDPKTKAAFKSYIRAVIASAMMTKNFSAISLS